MHMRKKYVCLLNILQVSKKGGAATASKEVIWESSSGVRSEVFWVHHITKKVKESSIQNDFLFLWLYHPVMVVINNCTLNRNVCLCKFLCVWWWCWWWYEHNTKSGVWIIIIIICAWLVCVHTYFLSHMPCPLMSCPAAILLPLNFFIPFFILPCFMTAAADAVCCCWQENGRWLKQ